MRRDAGAGDDSEFTAWLAADPRHRAAYLRLAAAWERSAHLRRLRPEGTSIDPDLLAQAPPRRRAYRRWTPFALAAGVAAVALGATWWLTGDGRLRTYRTEVGGLSRVVLTDGSTVTLNTDTELRVRLLRERRDITLVRGEAQFAVAHDASRPFVVTAGGGTVRAVGTAFDVRIGADQAVQILVTEGRVAVENVAAGAGATATVAAGEHALMNSGRVTVDSVTAAETSRRLAWEVGELSFQGETLEDALAEFNRYNQHKLKVDDPAIAKLQIGGNFQALDLPSFVAALQRSFNLTTTTLQDGTILLSRGRENSP